MTKMDVERAVAANLNLTPADLSLTTSGGNSTKVSSGVGWSITYLFQAGLLDRPTKGQYRLNGEGEKLRRTPLAQISTAYLKAQYPKYAEWCHRNRKLARGSSPPTIEELAERVESAAKWGRDTDERLTRIEKQLAAIAAAAAKA